MKKSRIKITHQEDKTVHHFLVENKTELTSKEVNKICTKMGVEVLFIEGEIYKK